MVIGTMTNPSLSVSQIKESDDDIKAYLGKTTRSKTFVAADNFKSYDELKSKLHRVISGSQSTETVETADLPPAEPPCTCEKC